MWTVVLIVAFIGLSARAAATTGECLECRDTYKNFRHGQPEKKGMAVRIKTKGDRRVDRSLTGRDGNQYLSKAEWDAFSDILHADNGTSYRVLTAFTAEGDSHTVSRTPFVPESPSRERFSKTVHGRNGVVCSDCHKPGADMTGDRPKDSTVCLACHKEVQETYGRSIHARKGATRCADCHDPHNVKSYRELSANERIAVCSRCHKDYVRRHRWLPNTVLHFRYLECATCHSPQSQKGVVFYIARKANGKRLPLSHDQLVALYGSDPTPGIRDPGDAAPADDRIGRLFTALAERDRGLVIDASIVVTGVHHDYSETRLEEKKCVTCHSGNAVFYNSMFFVLPGKEGVEYIPVRGTLISAYPIGGFVDFFLLGENKIRKEDIYSILGKETTQRTRYTPALAFKLIDLLGLLGVVLVLGGICLHILLRVVVKR